jgi:hypothetical protein
MKTISIKTTVATIATAATLLTSGIAPIAQANAGPAIPGLTDKIHPMIPGPNCATKPWLCGPGVVVTPPAPPAPPPAPPAPSAGIDPGALAAMGIVGGLIAGAAIANAANKNAIPVEPASDADAHLNWCYSKYKSYREWDNSWQPYHGPRKQCISPYY